MTTSGIAHRRAKHRNEMKRRDRHRGAGRHLDVHGLRCQGEGLLIENNWQAEQDMAKARQRILERVQRRQEGPA